MGVIFLSKVDKSDKVSYFHEMTKKKGGMLMQHIFLILAHWVQDKLNWTPYVVRQSYGQHLEKSLYLSR